MKTVVILFCFLIHFASAHEYRLNNKIECRPGQAINGIQWQDYKGGYLDVYINCVNVSNVCVENCEWRESCTIERFGNNAYVRGIHPMYDNYHQHHQVGFLCCNSSKEQPRTCQRSFKNVNEQKAQKYMNYIRQIRDKENVIESEQCDLAKPVGTLCALKDTKSDAKMLYGLAGLAGLSGLAGLALIKKKTCPSTPADTATTAEIPTTIGPATTLGPTTTAGPATTAPAETTIASC